MRGLFDFLFIICVSSLGNVANVGKTDVKDEVDILKYLANPGSIGKTHTYKLADLQKAQPITVSTGDIILVIEECKPTEAKQFKAESNNPHIKVRAVAMDGELRIAITADNKGDATVSWYFKVMGVNSGYKRLKIKIE